MRAAICSTHGRPDVVRVEDTPLPTAGPDEVRVRIAAASVNFPDVLVVADEYQVKVPTPFVVGSEFAGVIDHVGDSVSTFAVGDRVTGTALVGGFAEAVVVRADVVSAVPPGVDLRIAAAFGVAHRTAYHVLRSVAQVQPGDELIVLGAGGGVGLAAVQIGRHLGATVTAVASTDEKLAAAAACGATRLVNHRSASSGRALRDILRECLPDGADVIVDPVGGDLSEPALRSLRYGGRFVTVGYASGVIPRIPLNLVLLKGVQILGFQFIDFVGHDPDGFRRNEAELTELLATGAIVPYVGATFGLDDVVAALQLVGDGGAIGKVVLDIDRDLDRAAGA